MAYNAGNNGQSTFIDHQHLIHDAQKAFTMIKLTAEFFLVSKIKFLFNLDSIRFN